MKKIFTARLIVGCSVAGFAILAGGLSHARGPGGSMNMGASNARGFSDSSMSMGASNASGFSGGGGSTLRPANAGRTWPDARYNRPSGPSMTETNDQYPTPPESRGFTQQQTNETRVLDHRLDQTEQLRAISERNGNTHLLDTANRMESQANNHYDQRVERINSSPAPQGPYSTLPVSANATSQNTAGAAATTKAPPQPNRRRWSWWPFRSSR